MPNTSATGGYLTPATTPAPEEGSALEAILQPVIVGITGLAGNLVFPAWQTEPPNIPPITTDWAAFRIDRRPNDTFSYVRHDATGDTVFRTEMLEMLVSFYGLNADNFANVFSMGLAVGQNREALQLKGIGLVECGNPIAVPEQIKNQWWYRTDVTLILRRTTQRLYPVLDVQIADVELITDVGITETVTTNPPA